MGMGSVYSRAIDKPPTSDRLILSSLLHASCGDAAHELALSEEKQD